MTALGVLGADPPPPLTEELLTCHPLGLFLPHGSLLSQGHRCETLEGLLVRKGIFFIAMQ